jgi:hypothetical protein
MIAQRKDKEKVGFVGGELRGEIAFGLAWMPFRVLEILTGFFLVRGLASLVLRFLLGFKRFATLRVTDSTIELKGEYYLLGRVFRRTETRSPIAGMNGVRLENRNRYIHVLVGIGFLAIGAWVGMQWFVDGLKAGYPYLALVGAGVVLLGILIDLGLFLLFPPGKGRSRLLLDLGPWRARVFGIDEKDARIFVDAVASRWQKKS